MSEIPTGAAIHWTADTATILPTGTHYLVSILTAETETAGGIALPDSCAYETQTGVVLAAGPGRTLDSGATYPMAAGRLDAVVTQRHDIRWYDYPREAFVRDEDVVAIRRHGREHLEPANDYVLIEPDRGLTVDGGATVEVRESGILVAASAAPGMELRQRRRGQELYEELGRLGRSERFLSQPDEYSRHRVTHDFLDALSAWELASLGEAIRAAGDTQWEQFRPIYWRDKPTRGRVLAVGPGRVVTKGPLTGRRLPMPVAEGDMVRWDRAFQAVSLGGLWAVRAEFLAAVEE